MLAVAAAVTLAACGSSGSTGATAVAIHTPGGTTTSLSAFHGTPVIVNLWATWCHPCVAEMPALQQVADGLQGATVIGVNIGDDAAAAAVSYTHLTLPTKA